MLDTDELAGVLAHELGHIRNRDTLIMTVVRPPWLEPLPCWPTWRSGARFSVLADERRGGQRRWWHAEPVVYGNPGADCSNTDPARHFPILREYFADSTRRSHRRITVGPGASPGRSCTMPSQRLPMDANPATAFLFIVNPLTGVPWSIFSAPIHRLKNAFVQRIRI